MNSPTAATNALAAPNASPLLSRPCSLAHALSSLLRATFRLLLLLLCQRSSALLRQAGGEPGGSACCHRKRLRKAGAPPARSKATHLRWLGCGEICLGSGDRRALWRPEPELRERHHRPCQRTGISDDEAREFDGQRFSLLPMLLLLLLPLLESSAA